MGCFKSIEAVMARPGVGDFLHATDDEYTFSTRPVTGARLPLSHKQVRPIDISRPGVLRCETAKGTFGKDGYALFLREGFNLKVIIFTTIGILTAIMTTFTTFSQSTPSIAFRYSIHTRFSCCLIYRLCRFCTYNRSSYLLFSYYAYCIISVWLLAFIGR